MNHSPQPYSDAWLALPAAYIARVARVLNADRWWDDPCDPRDGTILLPGGFALVWDEESGWRHGVFLSGRQGVRTELAGVRYLGGGVLPEPGSVAGLLPGDVERPVYRSYRDFGDGLDGELLSYAGGLVGSR
ncbi:hypothetical protein Aph01nite_37330 [Acrocarpospora phusangensis]|uniref:DUF6292 domain-containing protein n=1 Tax=Acrocarpospora phusangensis TaxID=1070424 RepID=A0A919QDF8_9ACTN|nr:DUF6292 family protein [Acrocarpospora phusangensis]GIH25423.1 hypothetical protein Aph01nite_37330 [Acrocarpospora phusangensis]